MADLYPGPINAKWGVLQLYCWRCEAGHALGLAYVERLIYGLQVAVERAARDQTPGDYVGRKCLLTVLDEATTGELMQWVDITIERREDAGVTG